MSAPQLSALPAVLISLSSFGAAEVRRHGQLWFATLCAQAGADGVEVRGELLRQPSDELPPLAALARERGLALVYSSPDGLFDDDGEFDNAGFKSAVVNARLLGAPRLKMAIGGFDPAKSRFDLLAQRVAECGIELLIENDQNAMAGSLSAITAFLLAARAAGCPLRMTFDMGNWHWVGEDPLQCAAALAPQVAYVHCKGVQREPRQWIAVPMMRSAAAWRAVLRALPHEVPRAIEYPLQGDDLLAVTREQIALVRSSEVGA